MKKSNHLPVYGVGPICVYSMVGFLLIAIVLYYLGKLDSGTVPALAVPLRILGAALILLGAYLWVQAVLITRVGDKILTNELATSGVYAWVRNPIYSAIAIALTGITLLFANLWMLILPPLFWLDITLFMKFTEEKWLLDLHGDTYRQYCQQVNRCIPWFPKK